MSLELLAVLWVICSVLVLLTSKLYRIIIYFGIFSLFSAILALFLGSPDVAMAEAAVSAFATIFFIVCIEQYYTRNEEVRKEHRDTSKTTKNKRRLAVNVLAFFLVGSALALFLLLFPDVPVSTYLKDQYLRLFWQDVGGENAVTAILMGYRVYDTLFEALILVVAVVAISHVSWYADDAVVDGRHSEIKNSGLAKLTMRIVCPIILIFGAFLAANGHISAGGGFQGGAVIASFFICRFMVLNIYDMPIKKVLKMEEMVFINIAILPIIIVFTGAFYTTLGPIPAYRTIYLVVMNVLIALKVACSFFILFYRYIAIERLPDSDERSGP